MDEETVVGAGVAVEDGAAAPAPEPELEETPAEEVVETPPEDETPSGEETPPGEEPPAKPAPKEELAEFKGTVSARLKHLDKQAPGLAAHLKKFPQVRDAIAATFRREAAFRELYPGGLVEAQALRDAFPRGMDDVNQVMAEIQEVEGLDSKFYTQGDDGSYPGHADFIENLAAQDKDATIALLKKAPTAWAKLDPESYNETFSGIMARTLTNDRVYEHMEILTEIAKELKNPELTQRVSQLASYLAGFQPKRAKEPTDEERRIKAERVALDREKAERSKEEGARFHQSFVAESIKFQKDLIAAHPLMKRLPETIPANKKAAMIEDIRKRIVTHLDKIRPFKAAFNAGYQARDQKAVMEAQRNYWTGWLLNLYVRRVLSEETPGLVTASQAKPGVKPAAKPGAKPAPAGPKKAYQGSDRRWYRGDGTPFTTQEVLRGKHLEG